MTEPEEFSMEDEVPSYLSTLSVVWRWFLAQR